MMRFCSLAFTILAFCTLLGPSMTLSAQEPAVGDWAGKLLSPGTELRIRFHIRKKGDGLGGTMDSPDQNATGIVLDTVVREGDSLRIRIEGLHARYRGVFQSPDSLEGEWVQVGRSFPLDLGKGLTFREKEDRPQTPSPPYLYRSIDTVFEQQKDDIRFGGTVTMPKGEGPFPGIVLVSGSGPQDRNETIARHEPFHVIADHLTRNGFAVLRYDDRGVGGSEGRFDGSTMGDFVNDARSAYRFMKGFERVDPEQVGLLGHSEGGLVISRIAAQGRDDPAFLIMMASPALRGDSTLLTQNEAILNKMGMKAELVNAQMRMMDSLTRYILEGRDSNTIERRMARLVPRVFEGLADSARQKGFLRNYATYGHSAWFRSFIRYDPVPSYRKLETPVLALFGENDLQVVPGRNAKRMRKALQGNDQATVKVVQGVNHLFQPDASGIPTRYGKIRTTIEPSVLQTITKWMKKD